MVRRRRRKAFMSVEVSEEIPWRASLAVYAGRAREFLAREAALQEQRLFLWFPVFVSLGIGFYFSLPGEPPLVLGLALFVFSMALLAVSDRGRKIPSLLFLGLK